MSEEDWGEFARYVRENHELRQFLYQDPLTWRALDKPRGYAGDAVMMDYIYGIECVRQEPIVGAADLSAYDREGGR